MDWKKFVTRAAGSGLTTLGAYKSDDGYIWESEALPIISGYDTSAIYSMLFAENVAVGVGRAVDAGSVEFPYISKSSDHGTTVD